MGVRRFEELIAWQLADELHRQVLEFSDNAPASEDRDFCNQIRRATRSARANVAEGFGRYYRGEFVRYLRIAAASLHETKDHLHEARDRRFVTEGKHLELIRLTLRALKANTRLQQALQQKRRDG